MSELQSFFNTHKPKSSPKIFDLVLHQLPTETEGIAIDLCCGAGQLTAALESEGYMALGVDIADEYIGKAGSAASGYVQSDVNDLPFSGGNAQLICMIDSLQYFADPKTTITEIERLLAPNGHLILSTQNNFNLVGVKKLLIESITGKPWSPWLAHPIENRITYPWLLRTLEQHGFEIQYVRGRQFLTAWVGLLPSAIRNWSPWSDKPWRSLAHIAQRTTLPRRIEESFLKRFAMITFVHAIKR